MAPLALGFGFALIIQGIGFYILSPVQSPTSLIPSGFGLVLMICGFLATKENLRMHAMHVAALVALIGTVVPLIMMTRTLLTKPDWSPVAVSAQVVMAILCGVFLGLCVKSFIDARRRRKAAEAGGTRV